MPHVTLTKALKIKREVESAIKANVGKSFDASIDLDDREAVAAVKLTLATLNGASVARIEDQDRLSGILADIRKKIAAANVEADVDGKMAHIAHLDRKIEIRRKLVDGDAVGSDIVQGRLTRKIKSLEAPVEQTDYGYGMSRPRSSAELEVRAVVPETKARYEEEIKTLRRERSDTDESRIAANAAARIEIGDDDHAFLMDRGIV